MAKDYVQSLVGENERLIMVDRQHWFVLFGSIFLEIILIVARILLVGVATYKYPPAALGFVLVLVPVVGMVRDILTLRSRRYIITNRRVIQVSGIFSKEVVDSSLEKVNDVKMSQSFFGRMFGYGDVEILTASELGVNLFHQIANPIRSCHQHIHHIKIPAITCGLLQSP